MPFELLYANNYLFVYSGNSISVYNTATNNSYVTEIPLTFKKYGKFNPIYFNERLHTGELSFMALNGDGSSFYVVTPDLEIRRYSTSPPNFELQETFLPPPSIDHFIPLHSINILKYDENHNRLYWVVFGRDTDLCCTGNFHYKERYFAIFTLDENGNLVLHFEEQMKGPDNYYNTNISDVEFNPNNDYFYLTKLKKMEIWHVTSNTAVFDFAIDVGTPSDPNYYKFGEMIHIYIDNPQLNIHKIIALPYRYPSDALINYPMIVLDGNDHSHQLITAPSRRILDGTFLSSNQDLLLSYAPDPIEIISGINTNSDLAVYHYNGSTFNPTPTHILTTNQPANKSVYDMNSSFQLIPVNNSTVLISKKDQIVKVWHNENDYYHDPLIEAEGNYFYKGISFGSRSYIVNMVGSGIEYFDINYNHSTIPMGYPVYQIVANSIGSKLYMFNKLNSEKTGLYVYDTDDAVNLNYDNYPGNDLVGAVGDVVYNPYKDQFLIAQNKSTNESAVIKIINADTTNSYYDEIQLPGYVQYPKEMFIGPDKRLYVMANMQTGLTPKVLVYDAEDAYSPIFEAEITMPLSYEHEFEYYSAHFCYNPHNEKVYATIHRTEYTLDPYVSIPNSMFNYDEPFATSNTGAFVRFDDMGVDSIVNNIIYPGKIICPDKLPSEGESQYTDKMFVIGDGFYEYNFDNHLLSNLYSQPYNDITYSPDHDMLFAIADIADVNCSMDRIIRIDKIYYDDNNVLTFDSIASYDGQACGIFYNRFDKNVYIHYKFDDEKLGGTNVSLLKFDPSEVTINMVAIDLDLTCFYPELDHNPDYHYFFYNITKPYINPYNNTIYVPNGAHSCVSMVPFVPDESLLLNEGEWAWLSFPRLDRDYGNPTVHEVLYGPNGDRIDPMGYLYPSELQNIEIGNTDLYRNIFNGTFWEPQPYLTYVDSKFGYKLYLKYNNPQPEQKWLHLSGDLLHPDNAQVNLVSNDLENWIGYYLLATQNPFDAISDEDLEHIYSIIGQYWACGKYWGYFPPEGNLQPYWICACSHGNGAILKYGDMVVMKTDQQIDDFQWQVYGITPGGNEERPETENFSFTEQADYTAIFIEFDSTANPLEIGAFVEDSCVGATTVFADDSIALVSAYTEGLSGEIYFEEYYGTQKSCALPIKEYWVKNNKTLKSEKRSIHTMEKQDYYLVSFKNHEQETGNEVPVDLWVSCVPNPLSDHCMIRYHIPKSSHVQVVIYDLYGRTINILQEGILDAGTYQITYDGRDSTGKKLENGTYIVSIKAGIYKSQTKLMIIK